MRVSAAYTALWLAIAGALLALTLLLRPRGAMAALAAACVTALLFCARTGAVMRDTLPPEGSYTAQGIVQQTPRLRDDGRHIAVQLRDVTLTGGDGSVFSLDGLYWTAYVDPEAPLPTPGSAISASGRLYAPSGQRNPYGFDFRLYLKQNHMSAGFYNSGEYTVTDGTPPSLRARIIRLRYRLLDQIALVFREHAALPMALLLGERDAMTDEDRAAFTRVGIAHILAVSGLHISLIVAALTLLLRPFLSPGKQLWVVGGFLLLYALLLDLRPSVVRAGILTFGYLSVRARGRQGDPLSVLAVAMLLILWLTPSDLLSAGFQLSFAAALGLVLLSRPVRRLTSRFLGKTAGGLFSATLSAVAGTALPSIQTFHSFSLAGLLFSPIVCAALSVLLPACMALLLFSAVWLDAARLLAVPVGWTLDAMTRGVGMAAALPMMSVNCPSIPWPFYPLIIAGIILFSSYAPARLRGVRRWAILGALLVAGSAAHLLTIDRGLAYLQLDDGNADCAVLQDARHTTVVDCGDDGQDLCNYLLATGRRVQTLVLTHLHTDHCLGAQALMDSRIPIDCLIIPDGAEKAQLSDEALALLERLKAYCAETRVVAAGDSWQTPRASYQVLWPAQGAVRPGQDANDYSLCLRCTMADTAFLLTGDLSGRYEGYAADAADVLKVAHHGSRSSSSAAFLADVRPQTAIISVSANADAARPDGEVPGRLHDIGAAVYTTAGCGAIRVDVFSGGYTVRPYLYQEAP